MSHIQYAITVWSAANKTILQQIDKVQEKAIKLGIISAFTPVSQLAKENDMKLLKKAENESHILHQFLPQRQPYARDMLRPRNVPSDSKLERNLNIFPARALRFNYV